MAKVIYNHILNMEAKEIINKVKIALGMLPDPAAAPQLTEYKLKDGSVVSCDKLEVGGKVVVNGEPAPDGEHLLEDGRTLVVSAGEIKEVKAAPVAAAPAEGAEQFEAVKKELEKMKGQFASVKAENESLKSTILGNTAIMKDLVGLVEKAMAPVDDPIKNPEHFKNQNGQKEVEKKWEDMTPLEQYRANKK